MHIVHVLNIEGETVNECVSVYDSAVSVKPRESLPRSYPISLLRDPFESAAESLAIGAARAEIFDKNTRLTFSSNIPRVAQMFAEWPKSTLLILRGSTPQFMKYREYEVLINAFSLSRGVAVKNAHKARIERSIPELMALANDAIQRGASLSCQL
jgi:hypothetical protein